MNIVNVIPQSMSGETHQDSSPSIAVNPNNPREIVISALTPDPNGGPNAPVFVSTDGGATWALKTIMPGSGTTGTGGITLKYGQTGNELYTALLSGPNPENLNILRTTNPSAGAPMTGVDSSQFGIEQPYMAVGTVPKGPDKGKDRVYVGLNDLQQQGDFWNSTGQTCTIRQSMDAKAATPVFTSILIDQRVKNVGAFQDLMPRHDGPQVRTAVHLNGTVYAVFYSWKTWADPGNGNGGFGHRRCDHRTG